VNAYHVGDSDVTVRVDDGIAGSWDGQNEGKVDSQSDWKYQVYRVHLNAIRLQGEHKTLTTWVNSCYTVHQKRSLPVTSANTFAASSKSI